MKASFPALYVAAARSASRSIWRGYLIIVFSIVAFYLMFFSSRIFGEFGFAGGMIVGLVQILLLSLFYGWINSLVRGEKLTIRSAYEFDYSIFSGLISVAFIIFIVQYLVQSTTRGLDVGPVTLFLNLAIVVLFNAIPEVIVVRRYESLPALKYCLEFVRDNFLFWFAPLVVVIAPLMLLSAQTALVFFAQSDVMLPAELIFKALVPVIAVSPLSFLAVPITLVLAIWFTLFRMYLFLQLD